MIAHKRVRIVNGKVEEGPLQYSGGYSKAQRFTDIRIIEIPRAAHVRSELINKAGGTVPSLGKEIAAKHPGTAILGVNASFVSGSTLLGKTIIDEKVVYADVSGVTEKRPHFYCKDGKLSIGRINDPKGVRWAVCAMTLIRGGKYIFPVAEENVKSDVSNGIRARTAAGLKPDGTVVILLVDEGGSDRGMTQREVTDYLLSLGCTEAVVLDGGGSSTGFSNEADLIKALDLKNGSHVCETGKAPRVVAHVLAFFLDKAILFPKPKTLLGIDCATPLTGATAKAVAAEGAKFAVRYLVPERYAWKRMTTAEVGYILGAGMMVASVFQEGAAAPLGGAELGTIDGKKALSEAKLIGQPLGSAIFFAVDYDAKATDYNAFEAYLKAAQKELPGYHVGIYGHYGVIEEMAKRGASKYFWQTYAWSAGKKSDKAHLYQYKNDTKLAGVSVDLNESSVEEIFWNGKNDEATVKPADEVTAIVFGKKIEGAIVIDGVTLLPLRAVGNAMGGKVTWDQKTKTATIE